MTIAGNLNYFSLLNLLDAGQKIDKHFGEYTVEQVYREPPTEAAWLTIVKFETAYKPKIFLLHGTISIPLLTIRLMNRLIMKIIISIIFISPFYWTHL